MAEHGRPATGRGPAPGAAAVEWAAVSLWGASVGVLGFLAFARVVYDALLCGDDGPVDYYWDPEGIRWCGFLSEKTDGFALRGGSALDPGSLDWFLFAVPTAVLAGAFALRASAVQRAATAVAAGWALFVLVVLPMVLGNRGFVVYYVLPGSAAVVAGLAALGTGHRRLATALLAAGVAVSVLLFLPSCMVNAGADRPVGASERTPSAVSATRSS